MREDNAETRRGKGMLVLQEQTSEVRQIKLLFSTDLLNYSTLLGPWGCLCYHQCDLVCVLDFWCGRDHTGK